jgi:hypothetical protein
MAFMGAMQTGAVEISEFNPSPVTPQSEIPDRPSSQEPEADGTSSGAVSSTSTPGEDDGTGNNVGSTSPPAPTPARSGLDDSTLGDPAPPELDAPAPPETNASVTGNVQLGITEIAVVAGAVAAFLFLN